MTKVFRRAKIDKEKLRQVILKNPRCLLPGLGFIDFQLGTQEEGVIDFLGVDKAGRLVIVDFDTEADDGILIGALSQAQWLKRNEALIKRLFFSENVDFKYPARIILVCPSFSEKLKQAVKQIVCKELHLVEFKYLVDAQEEAMIFDEVFCNNNSYARLDLDEADEQLAPEEAKVTLKESAPEKLNMKEPISLFEEITLTPEEITEFINFDKNSGRDNSIA